MSLQIQIGGQSPSGVHIGNPTAQYILWYSGSDQKTNTKYFQIAFPSPETKEHRLYFSNTEVTPSPTGSYTYCACYLWAPRIQSITFASGERKANWNYPHPHFYHFVASNILYMWKPAVRWKCCVCNVLLCNTDALTQSCLPYNVLHSAVFILVSVSEPKAPHICDFQSIMRNTDKIKAHAAFSMGVNGKLIMWVMCISNSYPSTLQPML